MMELWPFTNFHDMNLDWIIRTIKIYTKKVDDLFNTGLYDYVEEVLAAHPEWTTTVMDGAISTAKLMNGAVTNEKLANDVEDCWFNSRMKTGRNYDTNTYYVNMPTNDADDIIEPFVVYDNTRKPSEYARYAKTEATINASIGLKRTDNTYTWPGAISKGVVVYNSTVTGTLVANSAEYLCIEPDRSYYTRPITDNVNDMVTDGVYTAVATYFPLLRNGSAIDLSNVTANEGNDYVMSKNPRSAIGFKANREIVLFACDGRTSGDEGLTGPELQQLLIAEGCVDAWAFDGGGSTALIYKGTRLNQFIDDYGATERAINITLNFKKANVNDFIMAAFEQAGADRALTLNQVYTTLRPCLYSTSTTENPLDLIKNQQEAIKMYYFEGDDVTWAPYSGDLRYKYSTVVGITAGALQLAFIYSYNGVYQSVNTKSGSTWDGWKDEKITESGVENFTHSGVATGSYGQITIPVPNPKGYTNNWYAASVTAGDVIGMIPQISQWDPNFMIISLYNCGPYNVTSAKVHWTIHEN